MTPSKLSGLKPFSAFLLTTAMLTVALLAFKPAALGQQGKGASSDDWFIKSAKDRKEQLQQGIKGGEKRDIIPSVPGSPIPQTDRLKPPSPDFLLAKVKWGKAAIIGDELTQDWNLAPNDMLEFHKKARSKGFKYMPTQTAIQDFSFNPALMPSILLGGVRELNFSPEGKLTELQVAEDYIFSQVNRLFNSLQEAKIFDDTLVIVGSGMSDGSRHSNKDLPVLMAGGGLKHQGHLISPEEHHKRVPLCNLWLSALQWFGVERDDFGKSTGTFSGLNFS
jgi:hypothetical protein